MATTTPMRIGRGVGFLAAVLLVCSSARAADPTTADCLNAHERALDMRNRHALRAARAEFLVCAASTCPEDVRTECVRRVGEVNAAMPTIVFEARDTQDRDLSEVAVSMDGQLLSPRLEGTALSIDPGEHEFEFNNGEAPPLRKRLLIREGDKGRREKVTLGQVKVSPTPASSPVVIAVPAAGGRASTQDTPPTSHTAQRVIGAGLGLAGIVGLSIAVVDQITAKSRDSQSRSAAASSDAGVQATAGELHDQARRAQTYAIVFGVAGAAALGTGLYLFLSSLGDGDSPRSAGPIHRVVPTLHPSALALNYVTAF